MKKNYGEPFDFSDKQMQSLTGNQPQERSELLKTSDAVIIPKPVDEDFEQMREGITVLGLDTQCSTRTCDTNCDR